MFFLKPFLLYQKHKDERAANSEAEDVKIINKPYNELEDVHVSQDVLRE